MISRIIRDPWEQVEQTRAFEEAMKAEYGPHVFDGWTKEGWTMPKKKTPKPTVKKAHRIARSIAKSGGVRNPWAVGMATAKKSAIKRKAKRRK